MYLFYGISLRGKVDQVPGRFYVATRFFHMFGIPLFPAGTYIVWEGSEWTGAWSSEFLGVGRFSIPVGPWERKGSFKGIRIRFSWKSFFFAWLRTVLVFVGCVGALGPVVTVRELLQPNENWTKAYPHDAARLALVFSAVATGAFGLLWGSFFLTRATRRRALALEQAAESRYPGATLPPIRHEQERP